jgi:hypothetical protein
MKKICALISIVVTFSACKKDTPAPIQAEAISPHTVSTASVYSGAFIAGTYTVINSYGTSISSDAKASFYHPPKANKMIGPGIEVRAVLLNGKELAYDKNSKYYVEPNWNMDTRQTWKIRGSGPIVSFNYELDEPTPSCTDFNVVPDSVSLNDGFTLQIPGVTNVTGGARIIIYDGNYNEITSKPVVNGDNAVTFSASDFAYFGPKGFVLIELENNHAYNFYGQDFIFVKANGFMKEVKFKP